MGQSKEKRVRKETTESLTRTYEVLVPNDSAADKKSCWVLRTRYLTIGRAPRIMGIVNVTPDSFSDGGKFADHDQAIEHGLYLARSGADILDIGGESTRPYSEPVSVRQELERVIPVIKGLATQTDVPLSIDTSKAVVARAAIEAGAQIINDVTGLEGDPDMIRVAIESKVGVCAMHMQGTPQTMQDNPRYEDVVTDIHDYLRQRRDTLVDAGIDLQRICLDPGIGFGKTHEHNLTLLANSYRFLDLGCPILVGHSRKGFIGKLLGDKSVDRDAGTLALTLWLAQQGVQIIRVHEVERTKQALQVLAGAGGLASRDD